MKPINTAGYPIAQIREITGKLANQSTMSHAAAPAAAVIIILTITKTLLIPIIFSLQILHTGYNYDLLHL